jgi:hypothetical protein
VTKAYDVGKKLIDAARSLKKDGSSNVEDQMTEEPELQNSLQNSVTSAMNWLAELESFEINASATVDWKQLKVRWIICAVDTIWPCCSQLALQEGLGKAFFSDFALTQRC